MKPTLTVRTDNHPAPQYQVETDGEGHPGERPQQSRDYGYGGGSEMYERGYEQDRHHYEPAYTQWASAQGSSQHQRANRRHYDQPNPSQEAFHKQHQGGEYELYPSAYQTFQSQHVGRVQHAHGHSMHDVQHGHSPYPPATSSQAHSLYPHDTHTHEDENRRGHRPNSYAQGYGYDLDVTPRDSMDKRPSSRQSRSRERPHSRSRSRSHSRSPPTHAVAAERDSKHSYDVSEHDGEHGQGKEQADAEAAAAAAAPPPPPPRPVPSIRALFSLLSRRHRILLLTPAIFASVIMGGIAPFMTYVVGQAFDAFATFPLSSSSSSSSSSASSPEELTPEELEQAKSQLLRQVGVAALSLIGLGFGSLAMGSLTSFLWIWVGEVNTFEVRKRVYLGVMGKQMGWFDGRMGDSDGPRAKGKEEAEDEEEEEGEDGPVGAGGLMAKFTRETDLLRASTSLAPGQLLTHVTTALTCLVLAFVQSWSLTLVILSVVPVLVGVQGGSQGVVGGYLGAERHGMAVSATLIDRTLASITTVKAFNAQGLSLHHSTTLFSTLFKVGKSLALIWGITSGISQFVMMGMFVQGFWFGAKLVREDKISAGAVMAVFWACLIATSNLQACIPQMITLAKGKEAMRGLRGVVEDEDGKSNGWDDGAEPPVDYLARPPAKPQHQHTASTALPPHMAFATSPLSPYASESVHGGNGFKGGYKGTMEYPPMSPATAHNTFFAQQQALHQQLENSQHNQGKEGGRPLTAYSALSALSAGSVGSFVKIPRPSKKPSKNPHRLRKIVPNKCYGEMALHGVSFRYPTRGDVEVLKDVEMYLPSGELTFVVGASGSGKSSVASLLLGLYRIEEGPLNKGHVSLDEQDLAYLDPDWVRSKVMGITQSTCVVLEGRSVAENIGCVVRDRTPSRAEIEEACRAALLHEFIRDLPDGYDTILGGGGVPGLGGPESDGHASEDESEDEDLKKAGRGKEKGLKRGKSQKAGGAGKEKRDGGEPVEKYRGGITLSGGQKQRLMFARARLRNPEVLILDEATSALDPTSRLLVFSAMKNWRRNKTTIVITHDLSQIEQGDFVYVIKSGRVVERGYRVDLEAVVPPTSPVTDGDEDGDEHKTGDGRGEFRKMLDSQLLTGGYLPEKDLDGGDEDGGDNDDEEEVIELELDDREKSNKHQSLIRPITLGNWMFDVVAELVGGGSSSTAPGPSRVADGMSNMRESTDGLSSKKTASWSRAFGPSAFKRASGLGHGITSSSTSKTWNSNYGPGLQTAHAASNALQLSPIKERRHSALTLAPRSPASPASPLSINAALANQPSSPTSPSGIYGYYGAGTSTAPNNLFEDRKSRARLSLQFVPATPSSATFTLGTAGWTGGGGSAGNGKRTSWGTKRASTRSYTGWRGDDDDGFQERYERRFSKPEGEGQQEEESFEVEKEAVKKSGGVAKSGRSDRGGMSRSKPREQEMVEVKHGRRQRRPPSQEDDAEAQKQHEDDEEAPPAFWALLRRVYPTLPNKPLLFFGLVVCVASGAMTPVFSFLLSRLLFEVSIGAQNVNTINIFGGIVLSVAAFDGFLLGLKYFIMELCGIAWVTDLRRIAFDKVLKQDTKWFDDKDRHSPAKLVQVIVKDAEDARNLVAVVMGQCLVVSAMLGVGLVWAMVRGWELTLVGLAVAPVFAVVMAVQTRLVAKCEVRNKRAREALARSYYESIVNIRAIRSLALGRLFWDEFEKHSERALKTGVKGAFVEGCTYGVASGLIYLAEALLFYVGAVLIANERYSYLQMVETLNLVVFSVTIGSQLMAFTEKIAKSVQATSDLYTLVSLSTNTSESHGSLRPPLCGPITLRNVSFAYPSRPTARVLNNLNLTIRQGECVAIVGHSGCGKSTVAALLQRLYEASAGDVRIGTEDGRNVNVRDMDVKWLRDHVAVVSQHPHLFDASVADNIRYGTSYSPSRSSMDGSSSPPDYETAMITHEDVVEAAKAASVHDFIMTLPQGYDTIIGENAVLISGGQAQRIQIARALVRPRTKILILDECTSALDPENQAVVMDTIRGLVRGGAGIHGREKKTIVMVTHKVQVMQMCDRIVVLGEGEVKEEGTFEELIRRKGAFASLASGGEWNVD